MHARALNSGWGKQVGDFRAERTCIGAVKFAQVMSTTPNQSIPCRAQTLDVLRLMGSSLPILMLQGDDDGFGTRWLLDGQQVEPGIARYLMDEGFIAENGATEFGARRLTLTDAGLRFRTNGVQWWRSLGFLERLSVWFLG